MAEKKNNATDTTAVGVKNSNNWNPASTDLTSLTNALQRQYENAQYNVRTADQRQAQAEQEYGTYYSQLTRAAQQQQAQNDLRLVQQRDALQAEYDRNREKAAQQYAQAYSQADRQLLSRGMQRSSYGAQTLANVALAGAQAQGDIWREQTQAENQIEDQRTQLAQQLEQTLAGYSAEQAADILKRVNELEQQDYDRSVAAAERQTNIAQQLYTNLYQARRDEAADAQWLRTFNENARQFNLQKGYEETSGYVTGAGTNTNPDTFYTVNASKKTASSGGGGGGGGGGGRWTPPPKKDGNNEDYMDFLNGLSGVNALNNAASAAASSSSSKSSSSSNDVDAISGAAPSVKSSSWVSQLGARKSTRKK